MMNWGTESARRRKGARPLAVGVGLPLTQEDFEREMGPGSRGDFVWEHRKTWREWPDALWGRYRRLVVDCCESILEKARGLGMKTYEEFGIAQWREASQEGSEVLLVTHWKSAKFVAADFGARLRPEARERLAKVGAGLGLGPDFSQWAGRLNELIDGKPLDREGKARSSLAPGAADSLLTRAWNRDVLDALFLGDSRPGNRLELQDGLHSVGELVAALPSDKDLAIGLFGCETSVFGPLFNKERPRARLFAFNCPVDMQPELAGFVNALLGLAARDPGASLFDVFSDLSQQVKPCAN